MYLRGAKNFANHAEAIYRGVERRTDLDKAYAKLISVIFEQIARAASESQKTPREVVLFGTSPLSVIIIK